MALQVSFRVVGVYCYFENLQLSDVSEDSTIEQVMNSIVAATNGAFNYSAITMDGKKIVDSMTYNFESGSKVPYNASGTPAYGVRTLEMPKDASLVWQSYRSVAGSIDGTVCQIGLLSRGQPSFANTPLDYYDPFFGAVPSNFKVSTYNLTWRLVRIQMSPTNQAKYMAAQIEALKAM